MSPIRCANCGREHPAGADHGDDPATGMPFPLQGVSAAAWASVEGRDLCPQCQSPEQRREVGQRIVAMIEREIERRQGEGISPDPYEAALVAYAMAIRARAGAGLPPGRPASEPASPPEPADHSDSVRLRIAFTGAFLTGAPLAVRIDGYATLQEQLGDRLKGTRWRTQGLHARNGTYETAGGGGFSEAVPLVVARREATDMLPRLSSAFDDSGQADANSRRFPPILTATPKSLGIDVYDLGVAVMTAWFDVVTATGAELDATARAVKQLVWLQGEGRSGLADALQDIASATAKEYGEAVVAAAPKGLRAAAWLPPATPQASSEVRVDRLPDERGRLLWLHPVHVLRTPKSAARAALDLAPAFRQTIKLEGGVFVAGIGSSAVVVTEEMSAADMPIRLIRRKYSVMP